MSFPATTPSAVPLATPSMTLLRRLLGIASILWICFGCSPTATQDLEDGTTAATRERAEAFFRIYAERSDFGAFLDFYTEDAVLQDVVNGDLVEGREGIRAFFDWHSGRVEILGNQALVVSSLVVEERQAIARGHFTEFRYDGHPLGPWRFVIALEFGADGRIQRQEDFINYPPALLSSANSPDTAQGDETAQPEASAVSKSSEKM